MSIRTVHRAAFAVVYAWLLCTPVVVSPPSCLRAPGQPVDWWVALKFPGGDAYAYMDSDTAEDKPGKLTWEQGYGWAGTSGIPLAATLQRLYHESDWAEAAYVMWNDEFPGGDPPFWESGAHAKGVLGLGPTAGFYLLHSVPKFPAPASPNCPRAAGNGSYTGIALAQQLYGQSFLCMTLGASELDTIAHMAMDEGVWVYDGNIPPDLQYTYPAVVKLIFAIHGKTSTPQGSPVIHMGVPLETLSGQQAVAFAKSPSIGPVFLYEQVVEPFLQSGMLWESWQHGPGDLPPFCPGLQQPWFSFTIAAVAVPEGAGWYVTRDHSKWGVTSAMAPQCCHPQESDEFKNVSQARAVCFGDLNRQQHQAYRGGSAVCLLGNNPLWAAWFDLVQKTQDCQSLSQLSSWPLQQDLQPDMSKA